VTTATALLSAWLGAQAGCSLPPLRDAPRPFRTGEVLAYDFDVMGMVRAGTLSLSVEPPISRSTLLPLRARVRNTSVFAQVRRVRGFALSWVGVDDLRPRRYRDESDEDGVRKYSDTRFGESGPLTMRWSFGDRQGTSTLERESEVMDLLSFVFYLRAAELTPGREMCADLVANRRFWRFRGALAAGTERVESPAGSFDAVRIDGVLTRADGSGGKRPVHWWFSRDSRRLPLAAVSEIDLGPVRVILTRVSAVPDAPAESDAP
jgi:hypothetical protein